MGLHADELMAAYKYEAKPHVRDEVVKDGLNIRVQVLTASMRCATCACTAHASCSLHRTEGLPACPMLRAAGAAVSLRLHAKAARLSAAVPVQFLTLHDFATVGSHAGDWILSG